jgi:hypothetical protein
VSLGKWQKKQSQPTANRNTLYGKNSSFLELQMFKSYMQSHVKKIKIRVEGSDYDWLIPAENGENNEKISQASQDLKCAPPK